MLACYSIQQLLTFSPDTVARGVQYKIQGQACLLFEELSLQRPPALTSADKAVLAT